MYWDFSTPINQERWVRQPVWEPFNEWRNECIPVNWRTDVKLSTQPQTSAQWNCVKCVNCVNNHGRKKMAVGIDINAASIVVRHKMIDVAGTRLIFYTFEFCFYQFRLRAEKKRKSDSPQEEKRWGKKTVNSSPFSKQQTALHSSLKAQTEGKREQIQRP